MKKTLLLFGLSAFYVLIFGQTADKVTKSNRISDFKNRMYLSTSKDPMAITKVKTLKAKELAAQELVVAKTFKNSNLKSAMTFKLLIDTTYTYPWNAETQDWCTVPVARMLSYYDYKHNLIQYTAFSWNYDTNDWQDSVQFFYKYNASNQLLDAMQQSWQFDGIKSYSWVNVENDIYEYNALGQELQFTAKYWNYDINGWDNSWQHEFTYDSIGNNISILEKDWDIGSNQWIVSYNFVNKFDSTNHIILNTIQFFDYSTNLWFNGVQTIYSYDSFGNNISMLYQTWNPDEDSWDNCELELLNYNSFNKIDNFLFQLWDPYSFYWYDFERGSYKYDSTGNNICITGEIYDPYSDTWTMSWENLYDYNAQNKQTSNSVLYYDAGPGNWYYGAQTKNLKIKNTVEPKQVVAATTTLEVFPNPASDFVNIRNSADIVTIQIFDILGNAVTIKNGIGSNNFQLNIANLKSGNYFLNLKDSKGISSTKRLVKK
jgi:Secretion system C-terminal sorting domain